MTGSKRRSIFWHVFLLFLVSCGSFSCFSSATDTLEPGQSIRDGQTLVSSARVFVLGFFSPGNSTKRYVGIWFYKVPEQTVVWVANRDSPIPDRNSGTLTITSDGNFTILDSVRGRSYVIAAGSPTNNPSAKLLDNGNLVLRETNPESSASNKERILWQSFDYPTDTLLPNSRVMFNKATGENRMIWSWRSPDDPATGDYAFGLYSNDPSQISISRRGDAFWKSRARNGEMFATAPDMTTTYIMNFSYISDDKGVYFSYNTNNNSIPTRLMIGVMGRWQRFSWSFSTQLWILYFEQPRRDCNVSSLCGSFGICNRDGFPTCECLEGFEPSSLRDWNMGVWSGGCRRKTNLNCGGHSPVSDGEDGFLKLAKVYFDEDQLQPLRVVSPEQCRLACLGNCSCSAYAYERGCYLWKGDILNLQQLQEDDSAAQDLYLRLGTEKRDAPTPSSSERGARRKSLWIIGGVIVAIFTVLLAIIIFYIWRSKTKQKDNLEKSWDKDLGLHLFSFAQIAAATNNFSSTNKLGEGGFGAVYKGKIPGGEEIAVKRLSKCSGQGVEEFINEVTLIAKVQHMNLVKLLGCCTEGEEKMLIYEFMPNKSLDTFLFDPSKREFLDWTKRIHIIDGVAQGLLYLHTYSRFKIIHRDLKSSNILLDSEMKPKISDFGLARIVERNEYNTNTNRVVGTYGYMAPEYAMEGLFSVKSDVYSFGVLLLEIMSGNKNTSFYHVDRSLNLLGYAWELWNEGNISELMDPSLGDLSFVPELTRYVHVALLCVQESASERPTMLDVISMIKSEVTTLPVATKPTILVRKTASEQPLEISSQEIFTTNDVSISIQEGR